MTQDLLNDTNNLARCLPVKSQSTYVQNAHKLERTICRAEKIDVSDSQIQISRDLIQRCVRPCVRATMEDIIPFIQWQYLIFFQNLFLPLSPPFQILLFFPMTFLSFAFLPSFLPSFLYYFSSSLLFWQLLRFRNLF